MPVRYRAAVPRVLLAFAALSVVLIAVGLLFDAYAAVMGLPVTAALVLLARRATRVYFHFEPRLNAVTVGDRRYPADRHGKLVAHRGRLFVISPGKHRRRVPVKRVLADPHDWREFVERVDD